MPDEREVVITDVKIPFWSMVVLLVKFSIAAIPAAIILMTAVTVAMTGLGLLFGTGWHYWQWGGTGHML